MDMLTPWYVWACSGSWPCSYLVRLAGLQEKTQAGKHQMYTVLKHALQAQGTLVLCLQRFGVLVSEAEGRFFPIACFSVFTAYKKPDYVQ
ncbi:MAG: hypothetical protein Q3990_08210 [Desulfovibrionaceae bacterium]|nr:hypothetical protein [Desulfovibrionaceae bacterium]